MMDTNNPRLELPTGRGKKRQLGMARFADELKRIDAQTGFKVSSRGWCYQLEGFGLITKGDFPRVQNLIGECRKSGLLPVEFVAEDGGRCFNCVYSHSRESPREYQRALIRGALNAGRWYNPDFWAGEKYCILMLVEKIDLVTLFSPVCDRYHVPIATSKGWSSITQRAQLLSRFKIAEEESGRTPVLLYFGDFDPYGLGISDALMKNLRDVEEAVGWSPKNLIVDRFGLSHSFIEKYGLSWIENLETGSGKKADESKPIVKRYVEKYGRRKVEANALVVHPDAGRDLCEQAIVKYLGENVLERWAEVEQASLDEFKRIQYETGIRGPMQEAIELLGEG